MIPLFRVRATDVNKNATMVMQIPSHHHGRAAKMPYAHSKNAALARRKRAGGHRHVQRAQLTFFQSQKIFCS